VAAGHAVDALRFEAPVIDPHHVAGALKGQIGQLKRKRTDDTRRKILVGAAVLAKVGRGEWPEARLLEMMDKALTRPDERALFSPTRKNAEIQLHQLDDD
jgi:hypothetical protein